MNEFSETFDAFASPSEGDEIVKPAYAMVEIFGHRQHYGEIHDVEIAGGKLLEVRDVDTQKVHMYGASAIFSLTMLSEAEIGVHIADMKRRREQEERWEQDRQARRQAQLAAPEVAVEGDDDKEMPF